MIDTTVLRRIAVVQVALCCLLAGTLAKGEGITLEVQPPTIVVPRWYQQVEARVVLRNGSSSAISKAALSFFSNDGFQVAIGKACTGSMRPGESCAWPVRVTHLASARVPGSVQFEASFASESSGAAQQMFATLGLTAGADATQSKPVEASLDGTFDAIAEQRPGLGYLLVTNNLDVPVTIKSVEVQHPDSVITDPSQKFSPTVVAPHSVGETAVTLLAADKLTPGNYLVLLRILVEWDRDGYHESRNLIVSKPVSVGIFFESTLLKLLGVPSFLLLPGCLFLFTMQLLVTLGVLGLKDDSQLPQIPITSPGFWIIAVTFSGLFAFGYTLITGTNYLDRYGVDDLRNAWLGSIAIGILAYLLVGLIFIRLRRDRIPTSQDDPITMLKKMSKQGLGIEIVPVKFELNKQGICGYPAERIEDDQTLLWVVPKILAVWGDSDEAASAHGEFDNQINSRANLGELAETLTQAVGEKWVSVSWSAAAGAISHPYHVKVETIKEYLPPELVLDSR